MQTIPDPTTPCNKKKSYRYSLFNHIIESNIPLLELQENNTAEPSFFFQSALTTDLPHPQPTIDWCHHWRRPDGTITVSVGKETDYYWIHFPQLVDFKIHPASNRIISYRQKNIPDNSVSHLLLDQVVPRLLSYNGHLIIHASCIHIGKSAIAFCGESGWGKSTLAAFFHSNGYPLVTDDCLLLQTKGSTMTGIPNYCGLRLFSDSLAELPKRFSKSSDVCHYASKQRIAIPVAGNSSTTPISDIFFIDNPTQLTESATITTTVISNAAALIELIKHSFPLDITNTASTTDQLKNLAHLINNSKTNFHNLSYPRNMQRLPDVMEAIIHSTTTNLKTNLV